MDGIRVIGTALFLLAACSAAAAQDKYLLKGEHKAGDGWQVNLEMKLSGEIRVKDAEKVVTLPLKATAKHSFEEKVSAAADGKPTGVARFYHEARADVTLQERALAKTLRPERRFQAAALQSDGPTTVYSPQGPLTDEELELTGEHLDVLALHGLLPGKEVALGEKWDVPLPVAQALTGVEGVITSKLECKLDRIESQHAIIVVTGEVEGILKGATTKAMLAASLAFDLNAKRLTGCGWRHKESKEQGPISPESQIDAEITATWKHGAPLAELTESKVSGLPAVPPANLLLLEFRDPLNRFSFQYERGWGVVNKTEKQTVLRLLERGELIAQLNVALYNQLKPGQHLSLDEVEKLVKDAPGFKTEKVTEKAEIPAAAGFWIGKVAATGDASDLPMQQIMYAVAGPRGDQALMIFTAETEHAAKLAGRDLSLVKSFSLPTIQAVGEKR